MTEAEAKKKRDRDMAAALVPEKKQTPADVDEANKRHRYVAEAAPEILFTELGWAVCRAGWIVKLFDRASDAHVWLEAPPVRAVA